MEESLQRKPEIRSYWLRLVTYFILVFIAGMIFSIPLVLFYPEVYDRAIEPNTRSVLLFQTMLFLSIVCATYYMIIEIDHKTLKSNRIVFNSKQLGFGFIMGLFPIVLFVIITSLSGLIEFHFSSFSSSFLLLLFLYLLVSISEEILIRGYVLPTLEEKVGKYASMAISTLIFTALHLGNDHFTWIGLASIAASGFLMALLTIKTGSVSSAIGLHWSWNFFQGPVFGFAVSGHKEPGIFIASQKSYDWVTGGKFGAEGSIILLIITIVIIMAYSRFTRLVND